MLDVRITSPGMEPDPHFHARVGGQLQENPFFTPPAEFLHDLGVAVRA